MKKEKLMNMDLQYFADDPNEDDPNEVDPNDNEDPEEGSDSSKTQEEIEEMIEQAKKEAAEGLFTADQVQEMIREEINKEKEFSEMSEQEREQRELGEKIKELQKEKEEFEHDKLISAIKSDLADRGLPAHFADILAVRGDKEKSLEAVVEFEKSFKQSLAEERKKDFGQTVPGSGSNRTGGETKSLGATLGKQNRSRHQSIFNKGE